MDWLRSDDTLWDKNMDIMDFTPANNKVLIVSKQAKAGIKAQEYSLESREEWQCWFKLHFHQPNIHITSKIYLVLGARANTGNFDPGVLSYLPFSKSTFQQLRREFKIHGTIARTINRNTSCAFFRKFYSWDSTQELSLVYNCRSTASWEGDLGLSVTFIPQTLTTYAVVYGCNNRVTDIIINRLSNSDLSELHPMVLVVLFAELERDRLDQLVRKKISWLIPQILGVTNNDSYTLDVKNLSLLSPSLAGSIRNWIDMRDLRNALQAFQRKVWDMIEHMDELEDVLLNPDHNKYQFGTNLHPETLRSLVDIGTKMKERLKHLGDEFDEHIRACSGIIEGVSLASQLEWNQIGRKDTLTNLEIAHNGLKVAQHARRDSELMKSIALLTMVFLPATFVATLFSMGIFEWKGVRGEILSVSPYIWLYIVVTVIITSVTLGSWYIWVVRRRVDKDVESGGNEPGQEVNGRC